MQSQTILDDLIPKHHLMFELFGRFQVIFDSFQGLVELLGILDTSQDFLALRICSSKERIHVPLVDVDSRTQGVPSKAGNLLDLLLVNPWPVARREVSSILVQLELRRSPSPDYLVDITLRIPESKRSPCCAFRVTLCPSIMTLTFERA